MTRKTEDIQMAYIIMTAQGCYGEYATVYSRHDTLEDAVKEWRRNRRRMISTDGGYAETHQPGCQIHREFASRYENLLAE